jgi:hypothetical protein
MTQPKTLHTRSIEDFIITITPEIPGGLPFFIDGGESEKFSVTPEAATYESTSDCSGNVFRDYNPDRRCTLTLFLKSTNPTNELMSGFVLAADLPLPLPVVDTFRVDIINRKTGKPYVVSEKNFINQMADMSEGITATDREWAITMPFPNIFHAGITANGL